MAVNQTELEQGPLEDPTIQPDPLYDEEDTYSRIEEWEQPEVPTVQAMAGSGDCPTFWYALENIEEKNYEDWKQRVIAEHTEQCGCDAEISCSHD